MDDALRAVLAADPRIAYAIRFGSSARGTTHATSDLDIAIELADDVSPTALELGDLVSQLELAAGQSVDLVLLDEAPPALAYRVFRDGLEIMVRDRRALVARKARAILDYLDFQPVEAMCTRGVLAAAARNVDKIPGRG